MQEGQYGKNTSLSLGRGLSIWTSGLVDIHFVVVETVGVVEEGFLQEDDDTEIRKHPEGQQSTPEVWLDLRN